jgi:hypothetical protein
VTEEPNRWIARIKPIAGTTDDLLRMPLSLDVWEKRGEFLVVAADEGQLVELERRRIADVERLSTVSEYLQAARRGDQSPEET